MAAFKHIVLALLVITPIAQAMAFTEQDVRCLAENIAYEAPDESFGGKLAVATVTMNRVATKGFPKTVCGVVYQRSPRGCQFSWVCEKRRSIPPELYAQASSIARQVLYQGLRNLLIGTACYYHADYVSPSWSRDPDMRRVAKIGAHIFYIQVFT